MPRIRTIKPEFPEDEKLGAVSRDARLMFILLWPTCCDDHGRFRAHPTYLRTSLFPYDEITIERVAAWLDELAAAGRVVLYEVNGERYGYVPKWDAHQRVDNAGKPIYPDPPSVDQGGCADPAANRGEPPQPAASLGDLPLDHDHDHDHDHANAQPAHDDFAQFWAAYPRRLDRKRAQSSWRRLTKAERAAALAALPVHAAKWKREHPDTDKFIPHPTTWLNGRRWEDEVKQATRGRVAVGAGGVEVEGAM